MPKIGQEEFESFENERSSQPMSSATVELHGRFHVSALPKPDYELPRVLPALEPASQPVTPSHEPTSEPVFAPIEYV